MINKKITLKNRPCSQGVSDTDLTLTEAPCDAPVAGEVRVRVIYLSIDPTIRLWLNETPPVIAATPLGAVVPSVGIGIVEDSQEPSLPAGTLVSGMLGWQQYCTCSARALQPLPEAEGLPLWAHLSLLGSTGLTAYFGLLDLGKPQPGETLLVSAAAGAVGSLVGQIGKIHDCRVIGIAGGKEKCGYLIQELGFDKAIDYHAEDFTQQLNALGGIDIFFDNIGGAIREAGLSAMNDGGRVVICGEIASAYRDNRGTGITNSFLIITKALQLLGLRVDRYFNRAPEAIPRLTNWALSGQLQHRTSLHKGLEHAPQALNSLFSGGNLGKTIVQVAAEPNNLNNEF